MLVHTLIGMRVRPSTNCIARRKPDAVNTRRDGIPGKQSSRHEDISSLIINVYV